MLRKQIDREEWFEGYDQLSDTEQILLQLVAIWYEPVRLAAIAKSLELCRLTSPPILAEDVEPIVLHLYRQGFLRKQEGQYYCPSVCREELTLRAVLGGHFEQQVEGIQTATLHVKRYSYGMLAYEERLRTWRIAVYSRDWDTAYSQISVMQRHFSKAYAERHPYRLLFRHLYDMDWFMGLPQHFIEAGLKETLIRALYVLEPADDILEWMELYFEHQSEEASFSVQWSLAFHWIMRGYLEEARLLLEGQQDPAATSLLGALEFIRGNISKAQQFFDDALAMLHEDRRRKHVQLEGIAQLFRIFLWLKEGNVSSLKKAKRWAEKAQGDQNGWLKGVYPIVLQQIAVLQGHEPKLDATVRSIVRGESEHAVEQWLRWLIGYWLSPDAIRSADYQNELMHLLHNAYNGGYRWIASELAELVFQLDSSSQAQKALAKKLRDETGSVSLVNWLEPQPAWSLSLQALAKLAHNDSNSSESDKSNREERVVWFLDEREDIPSLEARLQKWSGQGQWTRGRVIATHRLSQDPNINDLLSTQDKRVAKALEKAEDFNRLSLSRRKEWKLRTLKELVGHPHVFWREQPKVRVEIERREPVLRVAEQGNELLLSLTPSLPGNEWLFVETLSPTKVCVYEATNQHQKLLEILSDRGLTVPAQARQEVIDVMGSLAPLVTVHSDIGGNSKDVVNVDVDTRLFLDLLPYGEGVRAELRVLPLSEEGPRMVPGEGPSSVFAQVGEQSLHTRRDKAEEKAQAAALIERVESLAFTKNEGCEWLFEHPEIALQLLLELRAIPEKELVVRWPEGESLQLRGEADIKQMEWKISGNQDWFSASGTLRVDDELALEVKSLLQLLDSSTGRFLSLDDGQFIALTDEFRSRLDGFRSFVAKDGSFHASATFAMEQVLEGAKKVRSNKHWKQNLKRISAKVEDAILPEGLDATLRDYQEEGFAWLSRLAHWGFGACLADEMGLGKTLQTIALLLSRAERGPALVIAPTSVCPNWESEIQRFAPDLNALSLASSQRDTVLDALGSYDVVICSYGLLQNESEKLSSISWGSIVLDEAQAIKNRATKRSAAAMALNGEFRMITTGTPIENHLGELWNLYRFINPGLLGSWEHFQEHFAKPIERTNHEEVRDRLRLLIQPFLLRRRKADVLEELPPRTESVLHVEMSREETALYEALRQQALQKLTDSGASLEGQRHLQILAELMRLRRACCHPKLVLEDTDLSSSKLTLLEELLDELLENEHKVLVFSQFVGHLELIREVLDDKGIHYQYLDGSTPLRQRKKRIDAFQEGEGDVFLISLKAGGFGINLTAADYVIHMDPWWNPAVEDQASDRAHRIGQERPVTVYRLVTQHTIEEKIVALHERKRDLAESLLEGSDMTGKMSADELLGLIQTS